ncbi:hypothetical protein Ahy_A03g015181 [Arachis hypogaea]|uniref:MLO-like protein n=1 Tax=Arachis hypogaea TaxID=3818 RepID=A0A445DZW8_ARAHY|nr:hypothetical protein Ahy_A03g015181 [Arachis hypogaea]
MAAGEQEEQRTLEETPTWAVSICCFFFILLSLSIEVGLHKLSAILKKNNRRSLGKALAKIKTDKEFLNNILRCTYYYYYYY